MQEETIQKLQSWAELIGPNIYLQAAVIVLAALIAGKVADLAVSGFVGRLAKRSRTPFDDELVAVLHRPVFLSFVLAGLGLAAMRLTLPAGPAYVTASALKTIAIFIWLVFALRFVRIVMRTLTSRSGNKLLQARMLPLIQNIAQVVIFALGVYFLFLAWSIDVTAWLASAGIVGLALSFAARDTLANVFAGVSILLDAPYKVGDFVVLDSGERGMVTNVGLRSTRLLTRDDIEITIPNGVIAAGKIVNEAGGPTERHRLRIPVSAAYGSDIDRVIETLQSVAENHGEIVEDPAPRVRFRSFGESGLDFELLGWIDRPLDRGRVLHEMNCAVYKAFDRAGIEIPYPKRDVYVKALPESSGQPPSS